MTVQLWLEQYPPEEGAEDILEFQPPPALFQDEVEPAYFTMNTFFAYVYGSSFVEFLYEDGGWTRVNRAYGFQPDTTEQILHPEKYQQGDPPIFLSHPDLTSVFGGDWELIRRDSLGEWESYLLLAYNDFPEARRLEDEAQAAAAGWGDDQYWVYYDPTNNDVFLSVCMVRLRPYCPRILSTVVSILFVGVLDLGNNRRCGRVLRFIARFDICPLWHE